MPSKKCVNVPLGRWEYMFRMLVVFQRTHRHCQVPPNSQPVSLGAWAAQQVADYQAGRCSAQRIRRLERLGFDFGEGAKRTTRNQDARWERHFVELLAFHKQHGHYRTDRKIPEQRELANWISNQRSLQCKGNLRPDRQKRLEDAGLQWTAPSLGWDRRYAQLVAFHKQHGHYRFSRKIPEQQELAVWISSQRSLQLRGKLRPDRQKRLEDAGLPWKTLSLAWDRRYTQLVAFKNQHGHCDVPCRWPESPQLANWVHIQRQKRKHGTLKEERRRKLDDLGFTWVAQLRHGYFPASMKHRQEQFNQQWDAHFLALKQFKEQHGHCRVPRNSDDDSLLYSVSVWVITQRMLARRGLLSEDRRERLDTLGFEWRSNHPAWERFLAGLVDFHRRFLHFDVPAGWPEYKSLATWVKIQRQRHYDGELAADRVARLDQIGFTWTSIFPPGSNTRSFLEFMPRSDWAWEIRFAELQAFHQAHGHCWVPDTTPAWHRLERWTRIQRAAWKRNLLPASQRSRLAALDFGKPHYHPGWDRHYAELLDYKARFQDCDVPSDWPENLVLGRWVSTQRMERKHGRLDQKRVDRLNQIGFVWRSLRQCHGHRRAE
jgi:hypothetical protein